MTCCTTPKFPPYIKLRSVNFQHKSIQTRFGIRKRGTRFRCISESKKFKELYQYTELSYIFYIIFLINIYPTIYYLLSFCTYVYIKG